MADLAADNFNRANETPLSGVGNWTAGPGTWNNLDLNTNAIRTTGADGAAAYTAVSWPNDGYSEHIFPTFSAGSHDAGPAYRLSTLVQTAYVAVIVSNGDNDGIWSRVAGIWTQLSNPAGGIDADDIVRIECEGTTIRMKINGTVVSSVTDSAIASGSCGIYGSVTASASFTMDNWAGGDLAAAGGGEEELALLGVG